jgi:hypothetical protein
MMEGHSFWPIAQRVKEGWSLKNDSIIDSNITEGIPSFPPVESKVMAYHPKSKVMACNAMRATRSAKNDIREGGAILEVAVDDNKKLYAAFNFFCLPAYVHLICFFYELFKVLVCGCKFCARSKAFKLRFVVVFDLIYPILEFSCQKVA